jgi:hypothetical protein
MSKPARTATLPAASPPRQFTPRPMAEAIRSIANATPEQMHRAMKAADDKIKLPHPVIFPVNE